HIGGIFAPAEFRVELGILSAYDEKLKPFRALAREKPGHRGDKLVDNSYPVPSREDEDREYRWIQSETFRRGRTTHGFREGGHHGYPRHGNSAGGNSVRADGPGSFLGGGVEPAHGSAHPDGMNGVIGRHGVERNLPASREYLIFDREVGEKM